jgi:hypothetical protein
MEETYPPGTGVECLDPSTNLLLAGTVMDIPLSSDTSGSWLYQIMIDNGTAASIPLAEMPSLISPPPVFEDNSLTPFLSYWESHYVQA